MAYLTETNTEIGEPTELSLFSKPPNQVAVEKFFFTQARPISSITDDAPIEILVPGSGPNYVDLRRSRLYVKAQIVKQDGSLLAKGEKVTVINLSLQTLFSSCDVFLNNTLVSANTTSTYPYKAYLKTILSSGSDEQKSQLESQLFFKDSSVLDSTDTVGGGNPGLLRRYGFTKESREFELEGNLMEDIHELDKYLINGVDIYMKLTRSSAPFVLMSGEAKPAYKIVIKDIVYKCAKIKCDPAVLLNHARQIENTLASYYITRSEVKMNTIPKASTEFYWDQIFPQAIPNKIAIAFVLQSAVNSSYQKNPLNFQHFQLTDIALYVNGNSAVDRPLKLDFGPNRNYIAAFTRLFDCCEKFGKDCGLTISREDFGNGYSIFTYTLDPCDFGEEYISLIRRGNVRLEVKFASALTEPVTAIALGTFPAVIQIDQVRTVKYIQP